VCPDTASGSDEWPVARKSELRCEKSAKTNPIVTGHYRLASKELMSTDLVLFMRNKPNSRGRGWQIGGLTMPEAGTQRSSARLGSGSPAWCEMGRADMVTGRRVSVR